MGSVRGLGRAIGAILAQSTGRAARLRGRAPSRAPRRRLRAEALLRGGESLEPRVLLSLGSVRQDAHIGF